jgi:DNA (cytosine-5)-methyltransferase 1
MRKLRVLDLFSGIGGFSLGLERAGGFETVAFCEIEPYPRAVLAKHWPTVPCYDDVRTLTADALRRDGIAVDVICGGFPCQDLSFAGKRAGLEGARSGLWGQYARLIGELRPRFVIVENVPGLLSLGMGTVLGDLAALGYDATWDCIPAAAVGAPHRRDRVWLVAFDANGRNVAKVGKVCSRPHTKSGRICSTSSHSDRQSQHARPVNAEVGRASEHMADATSKRSRTGLRQDRSQLNRSKSPNGCWWLTEPDVGRVAHGVPSRVDRLRGLGNAVVPQIPELIGRAIMQAEGMTP